jgi:hypothetical protein
MKLFPLVEGQYQRPRGLETRPRGWGRALAKHAFGSGINPFPEKERKLREEKLKEIKRDLLTGWIHLGRGIGHCKITNSLVILPWNHLHTRILFFFSQSDPRGFFLCGMGMLNLGPYGW